MIGSASAPELTSTMRTLNAASMSFSPSLDISLLQSSQTSLSEALLAGTCELEEGSNGLNSPAEPDAQILEALRSKDRLWVLKLGEMMETLVNERKQYVSPIYREALDPSLSIMIIIVMRVCVCEISTYIFYCSPRLDLQPATTYQRMLVHKCSAYHRLSSETDATTKITYVTIRTDSRMYVSVYLLEAVPAITRLTIPFSALSEGSQS